MSIMAATAANRENNEKSSIEFNSEPVQFKEGLVKKGKFDIHIFCTNCQ